MKKRWLSFLLSLSMIAGSLAPAGSVYAEDMFISDSQEIVQDAEYAADDVDFFVADDGSVSEEFADGTAEEFLGNDEAEALLFSDDAEDETESVQFEDQAAEGTELPSYIFGESWNAQYDVLYYEAGKSYIYGGEAVTFQNETTVLVGESTYAIKNKAVEITVDTSEDGTVVKLNNVSRPVGQISGQWNSTYAGSAKAVFRSDIAGMESVESSEIGYGSSAELNLGVLAAGEYKLTGGVIREAANQWSPGTDFGDGKGTVTGRDFGYLPDITITVEGGSVEEDVYLGVNAGSEVPDSFENDLWLQYDFLEMEIGGTARINPRRVEEGTVNKISNDVEMPHFNYEIIKGDSVSLDTSNNTHVGVTAVKEGITVVKVTYDAFNHTNGNTYFPATDPVNTGYVVYSVGGNKNITIKDNIVQKDEDKTGADDVVFRSYDTLYYTTGDTAPFTLKASAEGAEKLVVKCNGITVPESSAGIWTLPLENRSNIIELTATAEDGNTRSLYHVLDARKIKINVENKTVPGEPLHVGQTATVSFTGITMPVYKLATIYNPCMNAWGAKSTNVHYLCNNGTTYEGHCNQWDLATTNSFDVVLDNGTTYSFTKGRIYSEWWGSTLGSDKTTDNPGAPNLDAPILSGDFSFMPDFSFTVEDKVPVESVTLDKTEAALEYGETLQLNAVVTPDNASVTEISWKSENPEVATVSDTGLVTAVFAGTTIITATVDGQEVQCTVEVKKPALTKISFTEKEISLYRTRTQALSVEYTPSTILDTDKEVIYTSSDDSVVSVDETGLITANKAGTAVITVTSAIDPSIQDTCQVEVKEVKLESITLDKENVTMNTGKTEKLSVSVEPSFIQENAVFQWTSSDENVAEVSADGVITAFKGGTCTVTVRLEGFDETADCEVTVEELEQLNPVVTINPEKIYDGDSVTIRLGNLERPEEVAGANIWEEKISYNTNIPGLNRVSNGSYQSITFTVPTGTPSGTYYLTDGSYWADFGGMKVQGIFIVGNRQETFYEGQLPVIKLHITNLQEVEENRENAEKELDAYVDWTKYAPEQQDVIKEILDQFKETLGSLRDEEAIDLTVEKAKNLISSIKTDSQVTEEKLQPIKDEAKTTLDTYVNMSDYREAEQQKLALITALAKLDIVAASSQEEIDEIVEAAKAEMVQVKTDAQLTEEEKSQVTPTPTPTEAPTPAPTEAPTPAPTETPTPTPSQAAANQTLILKVTTGKTNAALTWNKLKGIDGYKIYGAKCANSYKLLKTVNSSTTSWKQTKLKKATFYKYYVVAYKTENGKDIAVAKSARMHAVTTGGKYGNAKKITVNKSSVSLKKGRTSQLKVTVTNTASKVKYHVSAVRYLSTNPSVATVSKNGKIKGVGKGTCNVYCYAQNGLYKKVKVVVK
ncbi:Ig-like domain-containing protein [Ruminococcus sp. 5_1_39BFAA]|uniref:Ig-like domain-containing protein n=1 Tax=Ruminococcus sp. 5_1_39BFAA TaxID=457412 RepID=UPI00356AC5C6